MVYIPGSSTGPTALETSSRHPSARMVYIPGGTFRVGFETSPPFEGTRTEVPPHEVTISSFWMDITEVTNEEYYEFVKESKHEPPADWGGDKPPHGQEQWPVANVTAEDANAYAALVFKMGRQSLRAAY